MRTSHEGKLGVMITYINWWSYLPATELPILSDLSYVSSFNLNGLVRSSYCNYSILAESERNGWRDQQFF